MTNTANAAKPATAPQVNYLRDLLASREVPADAAQRLLTAIADETLTKVDASTAITWLQRQAKVYAPALFVVATPSDAVVAAAEQVVEDVITASPAPVTEAGMYENDHGIFRVLASTKVPGKLWAKRRLDNGRFVYAPSALLKLTADDRMTVERAEELSEKFGRCVRCNKTMWVEKSVKAGIGPKCRKMV